VRKREGEGRETTGSEGKYGAKKKKSFGVIEGGAPGNGGWWGVFIKKGPGEERTGGRTESPKKRGSYLNHRSQQRRFHNPRPNEGVAEMQEVRGWGQ